MISKILKSAKLVPIRQVQAKTTLKAYNYLEGNSFKWYVIPWVETYPDREVSSRKFACQVGTFVRIAPYSPLHEKLMAGLGLVTDLS